MRRFIYGGSLNPPCPHHEEIAQAVRRYATPEDEVRVFPCGEDRQDKPGIKDIVSIHRAAMANIAFGIKQGITLDLSDLENGVYTRTFDLDKRLRHEHPNDEIWHVVGSDLICGGSEGQSEIQTKWHRGQELWEHTRFLVVPRPGYPFDQSDLPANSHVLEVDVGGSSTKIRDYVYHHQPIKGLVSREMEAYILRHHLFTGRPTNGWAEFYPRGKPFILLDDARTNASAIATVIREAYGNRWNAPCDHILVIGGDGFMLRQIEKYSNLQLPFIGLNAGTVGFLLNDGTPEEIAHRLERGVTKVYQQPLLRGQYVDHDGNVSTVNAFNELYVRSATGQSIWVRVTINGVVRHERLVGDGLMLSTAAGSTGWARSYGAQPFPIGTQNLLLTGIGTLASWSHIWAPLGLHANVKVMCLDNNRRPMELLVDGTNVGRVSNVTMRMSRTKSVELGFFPETDLDEKVTRLHFPS